MSSIYYIFAVFKHLINAAYKQEKVSKLPVCKNQEQIATLFGTQRPAITKHLNNIFNSGELDRASTCSILEHMSNDGKQRYLTKYYNLDVILAVGYRVNSCNATFFRGWAFLLICFSFGPSMQRAAFI